MKYEVGFDITTVERGVIAHGVNCRRAMASGVAGSIRKKWPVVYEYFMKYPLQAENALGTTQFVQINENLYVANCFTQLNYGRTGAKFASKDAIISSMALVLEFAKQKQLQVYIPRIGCGLGGLDWEDVSAALCQLEQTHQYNIIVCEFDNNFYKKENNK